MAIALVVVVVVAVVVVVVVVVSVHAFFSDNLSLNLTDILILFPTY